MKKFTLKLKKDWVNFLHFKENNTSKIYKLKKKLTKFDKKAKFKLVRKTLKHECLNNSIGSFYLLVHRVFPLTRCHQELQGLPADRLVLEVQSYLVYPAHQFDHFHLQVLVHPHSRIHRQENLSDLLLLFRRQFLIKSKVILLLMPLLILNEYY